MGAPLLYIREEEVELAPLLNSMVEEGELGRWRHLYSTLGWRRVSWVGGGTYTPY